MVVSFNFTFVLIFTLSKLISTTLQGCRLILDMRKLAIAHSTDEDCEIDYEVDLTSNLELASHHTIVSARLSTGERSAQ